MSEFAKVAEWGEIIFYLIIAIVIGFVVYLLIKFAEEIFSWFKWVYDQIKSVVDTIKNIPNTIQNFFKHPFGF